VVANAEDTVDSPDGVKAVVQKYRVVEGGMYPPVVDHVPERVGAAI
jgi:hypothetical protein